MIGPNRSLRLGRLGLIAAGCLYALATLLPVVGAGERPQAERSVAHSELAPWRQWHSDCRISHRRSRCIESALVFLLLLSVHSEFVHPDADDRGEANANHDLPVTFEFIILVSQVVDGDAEILPPSISTTRRRAENPASARPTQRRSNGR